MKNYDIIVIGSGGGAKIITPATRLGLKVAVIEKGALGGTCLNRGCIPSKMLIHPADVALSIKEAHKLDIEVDPYITVNFQNLINHISNTVDTDSQKISVGYRKNPNIDFYATEGRFVQNKIISVNGEKITADKIFIAVGARPSIPNIPGLAGTPFMTSTEALRNTKLPQKMIVLGGGYIAVELGHAYGALGTQVQFIVRTKLLRHEDSQISNEFNKVFRQYHQVHLGSIPTQVEFRNNIFTVTVHQNDGKKTKISADSLLVATGVTPNTDLLNLGQTDIQLDPHGFVKVNEYLETNVNGIYALGDCIGRYLYRHSVNFEGEYLMRTVFVQKSREPIHYPPMPHAVFTHPQVAGVGKTADELKEEKIDFVVGLNSYAQSAMGMALRSDHGFVKILIERKTRKILGAHIIGEEASNMIHMLIAFMNKDGTLDDLLNMIYIHPALPEIVRNAARRAQEALTKNSL